MASKTLPPAVDAISDSGLPDFIQPPVDEVALSFQFAPIRGFGVPHFGLYWERIRSEYPQFEIQPPIPNVTEQLASSLTFGRQIGLAFHTVPEVRSWFLDHTGNQLNQVQLDRFVHNWRKITGTEAYPRYPVLRQRAAKEWGRFCDFLRDENLEHPKINQCEVTYVNNIEYERGWNANPI